MSRHPGREADEPLRAIGTQADDRRTPAARHSAPWARESAGPLGLLNRLARELVAARAHGDGYRSLEQLHAQAQATGHSAAAAHTRSALFELEAYRLAESDAQEARWRATDRGVTAIETAADRPEERPRTKAAEG